MNRIAIGPDRRFSFGGENFLIDESKREERCPSTSDTFTIVKSEPYLRIYEDLAADFSPRSILELGLFQGGGYVLLDKLFKPRRMSGVEISPQPVKPLLHYVAATEGRFVHFSTSQCDREILEQIVRDELADELDLVVDDASHAYEQTKTSFEFLFPLLQPGGIYIVEDWSSGHSTKCQPPDAALAKRHALSDLLFEQIMQMTSSFLIAEIRVWRFVYLIRKAKARSADPEWGRKTKVAPFSTESLAATKNEI